MLVVVPLLMAVFVAIAAAYFMFEKKSVAQSICVQEAVRMQSELGTSLEKLIALNPQSRTLRKQRRAAERAVKIARASKHPAAIATAQANLLAVALAQAQHRAHQQALLAEAEQTRVRYARELRHQLQDRSRQLKISGWESRNYYALPLAVRPVPVSSVTPDYVLAQPFAHLQQHRFVFRVNLEPSFLPESWHQKKDLNHETHIDRKTINQEMECSTTLTKKDKKWDVRILAASARPNY